MEILNKKTIKLNKELNLLDKFVLEFVRILEKHVNYVIVSGYVAILFGRARSTEDIDIIISKISKKKFEKLWNEIEKNNFWCLNATNSEEAYNSLIEGIPIRFAKKGKIIPNIELKFCEKEIDRQTLRNRIKVIVKNRKIFISPIEMQIAYKETVLKSEKDLEDALHLREIFREIISEKEIEKWKNVIKNG
jgi:hypothetical protein